LVASDDPRKDARVTILADVEARILRVDSTVRGDA